MSIWQTLKQNYERLGLSADPAKTLASKKKGKSEAMHMDELEIPAPKTKLIEGLSCGFCGITPCQCVADRQ